MSINAIGAFQDGGLKHNNPINLALWESKRLWPAISQPDIVLSLGTGADPHSHKAQPPYVRHILNDGFIPRTWRSFMSSLDGESTWKSFRNHLSESSKSHFFRLNKVLSQPVAIDDVREMEPLRRSIVMSPEYTEIAVALLASRFYLELCRRPEYQGGHYRCYATIRCRGPAYLVIQQLQRLGLSGLEFTSDTESFGPCGFQHICDMCHRYRRPITFIVRFLDESFSMSLKGQTFHRLLGGFPTSARWLVRQQGFDSQFGGADHGSMGLFQCPSCVQAAMSWDILKRGAKSHPNRRSKRLRTS